MNLYRTVMFIKSATLCLIVLAVHLDYSASAPQLKDVQSDGALNGNVEAGSSEKDKVDIEEKDIPEVMNSVVGGNKVIKKESSHDVDTQQKYEDVQHVGQTKNSAPEENDTADGGRDDSSQILLYSIPVTAVAFVIVCVAVVIRCRAIRADRKNKFGPGTEFTLGVVFNRKKMKGFHKLSTTDSDTEDQSDGSIF